MLTLWLALQIPVAALSWRGEMLKSARQVFGPGAPTATLAAQIHQESGWRVTAESWVGARGLAQFMPATATDMARQYPELCAPANPLSPVWALRCRDRYMASLLKQVRRTKPPGLEDRPCATWAFAFRAYNGGLGWVIRDRREAARRGVDALDWMAVGVVNAGRSAAAHRENKEYPERIYRRASIYARAGWGPHVEGCPV